MDEFAERVGDSCVRTGRDEVVDLGDGAMVGVHPCRGDRGRFVRWAELIVFGNKNDLSAMVTRRGGSRCSHRQWWCDRQPPPDHRVGHIERHHRPERITRHDDVAIGFDHLGQFARRGKVESFGVAMVVFTARGTDPTEIDRDRMTFEFVGRSLQGAHHMVVTIAAVQGVWMGDHDRAPGDVDIGAHQRHLDRRAIQGLEENGFFDHGQRRYRAGGE